MFGRSGRFHLPPMKTIDAERYALRFRDTGCRVSVDYE
jgi:hypothetical protein